MNRKEQYELVDLTDQEAGEVDDELEAFDRQFVGYELGKKIAIGIKVNGKLMAGLTGCTTRFHILYIETVYVDEACRRRGFGRALLAGAEKARQ